MSLDLIRDGVRRFRTELFPTRNQKYQQMTVEAYDPSTGRFSPWPPPE